MQKVIAVGDSIITCKLEKIGRIMLEGRIAAIDLDKVIATVSVLQMLNGKYEETFSIQANEQGVFSVEIYDDETDITISTDGYLDAVFHRDGFNGDGNVGTIPLTLASGYTIFSNITMQNAVGKGEAEKNPCGRTI